MANHSDKPGKIGLYIFGLGEILIGLLYAIISLMMLAIPKLPSPNPQFPMPSFWPFALLGVTFSSFIISLGAGTIMAKRWARKMMLILSWYGLSAGILGILFFIFFMGSFFNTAFGSAPNTTPAMVNGMKTGMMAVMGIFYIILPGIFVLFYRSKYVLTAVEYYDPQENWMDACPTPVFAVSLFSGLGAVGLVILGLILFSASIPFVGSMFPLWGIALFLAVMCAVLSYISIGFYRMDIKAWWVALILVIAGSALSFAMFKLVDPMSFYQQANIPAAQLDEIKKMGMMDMYKSMSNVGWLTMIPYLAYILFVRKYFLKGESE